MKLRPAIFLDRDGTLNRCIVRDGKPYPPQQIEEFELIKGVVEACDQLKQAGFLLVVITNQPDVERGTQSQAVVEEMHQQLKKLLPQLDHIEVCYSSGETPDRRRKPEPGMIEDAARILNIDLSTSWMIGDRWRDVECGKRAGVQTIFIDYAYEELLKSKPDFIVSSLSEAVEIILKNYESIKSS
jgi:D-glycero-D-manno-heptose 1,7-bisphosphate phosphatase